MFFFHCYFCVKDKTPAFVKHSLFPPPHAQEIIGCKANKFDLRLLRFDCPVLQFGQGMSSQLFEISSAPDKKG